MQVVVILALLTVCVEGRRLSQECQTFVGLKDLTGVDICNTKNKIFNKTTFNFKNGLDVILELTAYQEQLAFMLAIESFNEFLILWF